MLADAKLGGPIESAAKGIPGFKPDSKIKLDGWDGKVEVRVDTSADKKSIRVMQLFVPTPIDKLKAELDKKWGASRAGKAAGNAFYWADTDAGIRVKATDNIGGSELDFEPVQSIAQLMGAGRIRPRRRRCSGWPRPTSRRCLRRRKPMARHLRGAGARFVGIPRNDREGSGGKVVEVYLQSGRSIPRPKTRSPRLKTKLRLKPRDEMYLESKGPPAVTVDVSSKDQLAIWSKR
jgi:hypothetical protein